MVFTLRTLATAFLFLLTLASVIPAQEIDVSSLEKIGPVTGFTKTEKGITLNCRDSSQVQLTVLAPDWFACAHRSPKQSPPEIIPGPSLKKIGRRRSGR